MLNTILIGFGHAARDLHLPALRRLSAGGTGPIGAVEPVAPEPDGSAPDVAGVLLRADIGELVSQLAPADTVVHVCTPPAQHLPALARCAEYGYRRFVVEKPMVTTHDDIEALLALVEDRDLDVLVVANWLFSSLTDLIAGQIAARRDVPLTGLDLCSRKPRIGRSLASAAHTSAFEVEMPHLVALAMRLLGDVELLHARADDLVLDERRIAMMGGAEVWLSSPHGCHVRLRTDLCAPVRERSVTATWAGGARVAGHYPCDSTDLFSHVLLDGGRGAPSHRVLHDDTVHAFFEHAYRWFDGRGPRPRSDVALHARITRLLIAARERCAAAPPAPATDLTEIPG